MNFKIVIHFAFLILLGCGPKESRQEKINGINGEAVYIYGKEGDVNIVFREVYNNNNFAILLKNDTVELGDPFQSSIWVTNPNYKVTITSPISYEILSDDNHEVKKFIFVPKTKGTYDFKGIIEYDTTKASFEYKFIVIEDR